MKNVIYYLSFFSEDDGFLFPDELPENYYCPGLFLLELDNNSMPFSNYTFDAMDDGNRSSLSLVRVNESDRESNLYVVRTKNYGPFWFNLLNISPNLRYNGGRSQLKDHNQFAVAITTDFYKLERACQEYNFYFIGTTLSENEG